MTQTKVLRKNGWQLFVHPVFEQSLNDLIERVERKKESEPENYKQSIHYKNLKHVNDLIYDEIPLNPNARRYYLKKELKRLRRAKFRGRYRLFFLFWSSNMLICYIWFNNESSLRKSGSKNDPYRIIAKVFNFEKDDSPDGINQTKQPLQKPRWP